MTATTETTQTTDFDLRAWASEAMTASLETDLLTAIDVGTTKVCTVVARRHPSGRMDVVGHSTVPSDGLRKGNVEKVAEAEKAVRRSIDQAQRQSGDPVRSAFVGVTGTHITFENRRHRLESVAEAGVITAADLARPGEWPGAADDEAGRRLLHTIRMSYSLDGEEGIRNPLGMHSGNVEAETHVVSGDTAFIDRLMQAVENAGVRVDSLVLEPLASGLAVLTPEEKERGALLVDMGGGTTDVVGFKKGRICYTGVIPVGGWQFTNDIALTFNTTFEVAESVKLQYASTEMLAASSDKEVPMRVIGDGKLMVPLLDICQLTRERAQELARLVKIHLDDAALGDPSSVRLVLTGGASDLPGLPSLMQRTLAIPVRQGVPSFKGTVPEELRAPAYATSLGLLVWAEAESFQATSHIHRNGSGRTQVGPKGALSRFLGRVARLSPFARFGTRKGSS